MYANRYRQPVEKVTDDTIPTRIDALLAGGEVNDWEKAFLTSIKSAYEKYKSLTKGQFNTFSNVEKRHDPAAKAARQAWHVAWDEEKNRNWQAMMEYYVRTSYYQGAVEKWKKEKFYIPSEKEYNAVCGNKYAIKFLKNRAIPAKFAVGSLAVYKRYGTYVLCTIIEVGDVNDWAKGSRTYKINVIGEAQTDTVFEKELLYYRESILKKITLQNEMPF